MSACVLVWDSGQGGSLADGEVQLAEVLERAGHQVVRVNRGAAFGPLVGELVAGVFTHTRWPDAIVVDAVAGRLFWSPFAITRIARLLSRPAIVVLRDEGLPAFADRHPRRVASTLQLATSVVSASRSLRQFFETSGQPVAEVSCRADDLPVVEDGGDALQSWHTTLTRCGVTRPASLENGCGPLAQSDLARVVDIHRAAFPDSAITQLGDAVIHRYYAWQFIGPHPAPVAIGVWRDGRIVGFLFGGRRQRAVVGFVRRYVGAIALGAMRHPGAVRRLAAPKVMAVAKLLAHGGAAGPTQPAPRAAPPDPDEMPAPTDLGPSFGVLSVAVAAEAQGTGAAQQLLLAAEAAAADDGLMRMHLTVQTENGRAIAFYEKLGWKRQPDADGWHGAMTKSIALLDAHVEA